MKKLLVVLIFALVGLQDAIAFNGQVCAEGTIYLQAPSSWTEAYASGGGTFIPFKKQADGWWTVSSASVGFSSDTSFFITSANNDYCQRPGITTKQWNQAYCSTIDRIPCSRTGDLYVFENPTQPGVTVFSENPPNAKYFFVMIPPDFTEWMSSNPMISKDGGKSGKLMKVDPEKCGWYSYVFFNEEITDDVVLYRDDDVNREDLIGLNGNWEKGDSATPIPLKILFDYVDTLYFVPDEEQLLADGDDGFYYTYPDGVAGACQYDLAAIIYDTDASLHGAFTCTPDWTSGLSARQSMSNACRYPSAPYLVEGSDGVVPCIGVTQGMVDSILNNVKGTANYKKPTLTAKGRQCFGSKADEAFSAMFNSTPNVNETYCVDMPFKRSSDGKWEFDSDTYQSPGATVPGGFYPAEKTPSTDRFVSAPLPAAETKRKAEGPIYYGSAVRALDPAEDVPVIDVVCNGPGWNKGFNCEGQFAEGESTTEAITKFLRLSEYDCVYGWSCPNDAPQGWTFFVDGTETVDTKGMGTPRWTSEANASGTGGRNQHFCFESHAKFTYRPGLRFSFRGDDDIWVYIDNKLAVDLGGTHLAAPGYVDLDSFMGNSGALLPGGEYDLDIFFCDRRTTMSNVRIKTNMYIRQKTTMKVSPSTVAADGSTAYHICYTKSGDGSCAAALTQSDEDIDVCDEQIPQIGLDISYTLVNGVKPTSPAVSQLDGVRVPGKYFCGIDLTNFTSPVVNKDAVCGLGPGRYQLYVTIDGNMQKVGGVIRVASELDVVYKDAVTLDDDGNVVPGGSLKVKKNAMGGELVPVYISAVGEDGDELIVSPELSAGQSYTLSYDKKMLVFKDAAGTIQLNSGEACTVGASGIDTVYVTVPMEDLDSANNLYTIGVTGRTNVLSINFYLPRITFVESIPDAGIAPVAVTGKKPEADGSYEEFWVGSMYDFYLMILKPDESGNNYYPCLADCDGLKIHKDAMTSNGINFADAQFKDSYATISVSSSRSFRYDLDPVIHNPGVIVVAINDHMKATYNPVYFREAPVSSPKFADVFDVHGSTPSMELDIPAPYFDMNQEYLDGIGDSVAIYFQRAIHRDSLPSKVCIVWDSASAERYNPLQEGFSNVRSDTVALCNVVASVTPENINCSESADGYCSNVITLGGFNLSEKVKTSGKGRVISYAVFEDKGKVIKQGFSCGLIDRIAPVPLRAELRAIKDTELDSLVVVMSEPVLSLGEIGKMNSALDFYLNSATEVSESNRFMSALNSSAHVVSGTQDPIVTTSANGEGRIKFIYDHARTSLYPQPGDYVRLAGNLSSVLWSDDSTGRNLQGSDTLRVAADAAYYWNSPTAYNETKRLPSPWVAIELRGNGSEEDNPYYAKPSFRLKMTGPFEFTIVMDDALPAKATKYAVMDLQGRIIRKGDIRSSETVVPMMASGSYVVKVGYGVRRVNLAF